MFANLERPIPIDELYQWLAGSYGVATEAVLVCEDYNYLGRWPPLVARIKHEHGGSFPVTLEVIGEFADAGKLELETRRLQALCRHFALRAVVGDESVNPYTWVLVDERGQCWWIAVNTEALDDREELLIAGPCETARGSIATVEPVDGRAVAAAFAEACQADERHVGLETWELARRESGASDDGTYAVVGSAHYRHLTVVRLIENPRPWRPQSEAARIWVGQAVQAARRLGVPLCIHHEAFFVVSNIPGGSDSAQHCYEWNGETLARVDFKTARPRW